MVCRMGTKHLTPDQKQQILVTYQALGHPTLVSETLGFDRQRVIYFLRQHGLATSKHRQLGACQRNADLIRRRHSEGASMTKIAREVHTCRRYVRDFLLENGLRPHSVDLSGAKNPAWRGGRMLDKHGYVLLWKPEHPQANRHGYVREHRLVMEQALGRFLTRSEVVHHRDGIRSNNDPSNLELFASNGLHLHAELKGVPCPARGRPGIPNGTSLAGRKRGTDGRLLPGKIDRIRA
jgi:hypothetical protein